MSASGPPEAHARIARELVLRTLLLARLPGEVDDARLGARLADAIEELTLPDGEPLYGPGDTSEHVFVVAEGRVALVTERRRFAFGPGEPVGMLDALRRRPRAGRAWAEGGARLLRFRVDDWLELLEDNFTHARHTVMGAARLVHELSLSTGAAGATAPGPPAPGVSLRPAADLNDVERALALRAVPALQRASVQALMDLARLASGRALAPGDLVFEARRQRHLYVVARGLVRARRRGEPPFELDFGPGSLVAGLGALAGLEEQFEARAVEPSLLVTFEREDYFDLMEDHFDVVRSALTALIEERERLLSIEAPPAPSARLAPLR
ncbi:MAG TPA: cyclic nucleotide-binding domain-containing protein [Polyangiaceae bacterium]|nr:cyclic nucleotide-binding domain-containing protein [Polyangiaceae bacterium]